MRRSPLILLLFLGFILFYGCDDDDSGNIDKTALLTSKLWKFYSIQARLDPADPWQDLPITKGTTTIDSYPCRNDDISNYQANGEFSIDAGATKCNEADPQATYGSWSFSEDQTKLIVTMNNLSTEYSLIQLDSDSLKIELIISGIYVLRTSSH